MHSHKHLQKTLPNELKCDIGAIYVLDIQAKLTGQLDCTLVCTARLVAWLSDLDYPMQPAMMTGLVHYL